MAEQDIRVVLRPDGIGDVIAGLRAVKKETQDTGKQMTGIAGAIRREFKNLLPTIGLAAAVTGLAVLAKNAAAYADEIGKAATRTGSSAENFSVLAFAAKTADVSFEDLQGGLIRTARAIEQLRSGTGEQADALRELGFAAADFDGKDTAEGFNEIALALAKVENQTERTAKAQDIFGRSGARLLTLIDDLANRGFTDLEREARRMGLVIGTDVAKAAAAANDALTLVGQQAKGVGVSFISGLAGPVAEAMEKFTDATSGAGVDGVKELGSITGKVINGIVRGFLIAGETVAVFAALVSEKANNLGATLADVGKQAAAGGALGAAGGAAVGSIVPGVGTGVGAGAGFLAGAVSGAIRSLTTPTAGAQEQLDILEEFRLRVAKILDETDPKEIEDRAAALRKLVGGGDGDVNKKTLQQQLSIVREKSGSDELKVLEETARRRRQIAEESIALESVRTAALLANQGETLAAQQAISAAEESALRARVQAVTDAFTAEQQVINARQAALTAAAQKEFTDQRVVQQLTVQITKESVQQRLDLATRHVSDLNRLQGEYLRRYEESQKKIRAIDQESAEFQKKISQITTAAASAAANEGLSQAEKHNAALKRLEDIRAQIGNAALRNAAGEARQLADEALSIFQELASAPGFEKISKRLIGEVKEFLTIALDGEKKVAQAAGTAASAASKSIDQQLAEALKTVEKLQADLLKGLNVKFIGDDKTLIADLSKALLDKPFKIRLEAESLQVQGSSQVTQLAGGGQVPGVSPHPNADDKLIAATSGEFMHPVAAVKHYGVRFMEMIRSRKLPKYAEGGPIEDSRSGRISRRKNVDEDETERHLSSRFSRSVDVSDIERTSREALNEERERSIRTEESAERLHREASETERSVRDRSSIDESRRTQTTSEDLELRKRVRHLSELVPGAIVQRASGGLIPGIAPHPRADNVLARLTPGEYVMPVAAVQRFGVGFMDQVRAGASSMSLVPHVQVPRFADGGLVRAIEKSANEASSGEVVSVDLRVNGGEPVRLTGARDRIRQFQRDLTEATRGQTRK